MLLTCLLAPRVGVGQACDTQRDDTHLGHLNGLVLDSVAVQSAPPLLPPAFAPLARRLHARTSRTTVLRLFDQPPGAPIDTIRLAESIRTLKRARILSDVQLDARACPDSGRVSLTLRTTDAWSVRGGVRLGGARASASLGDDNLLGSGRSLGTSLRLDEGQPGFGVQYRDPWFVGSSLALAVSRNHYRGGSESSVRLATSPQSVLDSWRGDIFWSQASRRSLVSADDRVTRGELHAMLEHRLWTSPSAVTALTLGFEHLSASLQASAHAQLIGPPHVTREVYGGLLGVTRRSLSFVARPIVPGSGEPVEVPTAFEGDVAITLGRDAAGGGSVQHVDTWIGKLWPVGPRALVSANGWWSGFRAADGWSAGDGRASLLAVVPTTRGQWTVRVASELLLDPDPDTRALISFDPTARLLPARGLAEAASLLSIERDRRFHQVTRGYQLGGALFVAASRRWDLAGVRGNGPQDVFLVGTGLRLLPTRAGRATLRLDLAVPVGGTTAPRRPVIAFSISPWLEHERHREGRPTP